jgi:hypothetical protein
MDWDAHLAMVQEVRKRRYDQAQEATERAVRLRAAFANKNWNLFELIKAEVATDARVEEELASGILEDKGTGSAGSDSVDPPMSGDE